MSSMAKIFVVVNLLLGRGGIWLPQRSCLGAQDDYKAANLEMDLEKFERRKSRPRGQASRMTS